MIYFKYNIYITKNHWKVRFEESFRFFIFLLRSVSGRRKLDPICHISYAAYHMLQLFPCGKGPYLYPNKYIPMNDSSAVNAKPVRSHIKLNGLSENTNMVPIGCIDIAPIVFPTPKIKIHVFDILDNLCV